MIRSVTLTFSIISERVWMVIFVVALEPLHQSVFHPDDVMFLWVVAGLTGWLGGRSRWAPCSGGWHARK